jgi:hypothetical protein
MFTEYVPPGTPFRQLAFETAGDQVYWYAELVPPPAVTHTLPAFGNVQFVGLVLANEAVIGNGWGTLTVNTLVQLDVVPIEVTVTIFTPPRAFENELVVWPSGLQMY